MRYPFTGQVKITQKFWQPNAALTGGFHKGTDYSLPTGSPIFAITAGKVIMVGTTATTGHYVDIQSGELIHRYFHLSQQLVSINDTVKEGDHIGNSGATGLVTGPHLHLQTTLNGVLVDPEKVINNQGVTPQPSNPPAPSSEFHVVKRNETFWGLESRFKLPHGTLTALNPGVDPRKLQIGQQIRIQPAPNTPQPIVRRLYTIKKKDTFWALENAWRMPHGSLQRLNPGVNPRLLQIGQSIHIS